MKEEIIRKIEEEEASVIVLSPDGRTASATGHTILPLVELIEREPELFRGGFVADKVIGKGAASLLVRAGAASVYAKLMGEAGLEMLRENGVEASWNVLTPLILNNRGDGSCPVEALVKDIEGVEASAEAVLGFAERLRRKA